MLDVSGRMRPTLHKASDATSIQLSVETLADALVAQIAGTMCGLFAARICDPSVKLTHDLVDSFLKQSGTVSRSDAELKIFLPMTSINLELRRAGLDQDPGWIPWINATAKFEFLQDHLSEVDS